MKDIMSQEFESRLRYQVEGSVVCAARTDALTGVPFGARSVTCCPPVYVGASSNGLGLRSSKPGMSVQL